jgi:hypothetical protein
MNRVAWYLSIFAIALAAQTLSVRAQVDPLDPIPGGALPANVVCVQYGDLNTGLFNGTFLQTGPNVWEQREHEKPGLATFQEKKRDDAVVELFDPTRAVAIQFDFARRKVRFARATAPDDWRDLNFMLNATDKDGSKECVAFAKTSGPLADGKPRPPKPPPPPGTIIINNISITPGTAIKIAPGTKITATQGTPIASMPGFFLCPNKFSVRPEGGVCCPGAGACAAGSACSAFGSFCVPLAAPEMCKGTFNAITGVALHCSLGTACNPGPCVGGFCCP